MRRRDLLTAAGASLAALTAPRIGRADQTRKLVFVPASDLTLLDPVVTGSRSTRNHAYLVFDTLYGIDTNWTAQPQMVERHSVDDDGDRQETLFAEDPDFVGMRDGDLPVWVG